MDQMQSFGSLSLGSRLRRLSDRLVADVVEIYQAQGVELNPTFFPLFNLLYRQGAMSVTEAAELLGVSHPAISKIARKMLSEQWLSKTTDPTDERRQLLALSERSHQLLERIKPIWQQIQSHLDQLMAQQRHPLLAALDEFELKVEQQGFKVPVLAALADVQPCGEVEIIGWDSRLRDHFRDLNLDWLERYFNGELTEQDQQALYNPEGYYLARGGYIWFARSEGRIVGCCALARHGEQRFEISKMGVDDGCQGQGVGRRLMLAALAKARELGAREVYLESATKLERAINLYRNLGFRAVPHPDGQSIYPRSDIYMTLTL
ncbi:bifunctional helix-turn-helix transcriptional regulator/GNAT family N-acetyltransferase [Marinobacterium arenosum]|uniref:bifunctional helix-turn-helix transcriptional regulator/GNAT family N-acetyltransferase n=1 Tax=Marinobacterium arenosum TaxID=2862496 RepID=UPI001C95A4D4|nr:bifunctional helix-turn-helix transcriptional regulator/GNAT family N-acetyltransferase [Marinobacterium arenosum]MBY4675788.1 bifunctional helix-turn-helix transcriptional regulator/GNAT family N-acetyltransferase [Marinobacterium arenosum]